MPSLKTCLMAAALACLSYADTIKITATSRTTFDPATVHAKQGDTLEFHFQSRNHSVVSGAYENPCSPLRLGTGFFSGFVPVQSGESNQTFRVTVTNTDPTPFYSSQGDECIRGMVGIINPNNDKTLEKYRSKAVTLAGSITPGNNAYGGDMVDSNSNTDNTGNTGCNAGGNSPKNGIIESLQHLHDELREYHAPAVVHPSLDVLKPAKKSVFASIFGKGGGAGAGAQAIGAIPKNLPRGLYLYGDVGSGKTMLMDLFYDTLPPSVKTKTRIHFHNFMQLVHKRLHRLKMEHGSDIDAVPYVAADFAEQGNVLCFDEFQCTDVADAMILRRLLEALMSHGVVLVTTSNRLPDDLYKNGIQRESFIPAIKLLKNRLHVINLDSPTDYRKIPRPPSGVYHTPLDQHAASHAEKWFRFLGDSENFAPHPETQKVWGRDIYVPRVSGRCAWFTFDELIGKPKSAADYLELVRCYDAFIVTDVPGMTIRERDLARRFITFIDAVYEGNAKLVLTTEKPITELFVSRDEIAEALLDGERKMRASKGKAAAKDGDADVVEKTMDAVMEDLEQGGADKIKDSGLFAGQEEAFAFARALSRLSHMESKEWVERGMGLESKGGKQDRDNWSKTRSRQMEDSM
ncbi:mitochondrial ATPase (Afg1) [Purpureocillium lilacinum]|uniref:Mitochondrial ATPase (Afg1) n=1 Tax=Purpureocillium lilacinum TaxID=33203 RepID=A0A179H924_PURLI|nr:mitochondrial ATPase (Afg1) [Purpureocillium lilacinum]OAQ86766.1 mitochondrial ATPase (Afg1) [Purpureocillium lilacinum]OAQ94731.1 mitochondrial ATPase (Afg1) [Purpureocillium lilacinum]